VHFPEPHHPSERTAHLIDLCTRQAVDAIESARLFVELQEADRRKDDFLATLAHELRNPLAPIRNSLHILRLSGELTPAGERVHEMMERQVNCLVRLVDDLLEVSRISRGKIELRKENIAVAAIIRQAVETSRPLIDAAGHQLAISLPTEVLTLHGDLVRLAQVVSNLLNNSARYTETGGQIWLNARRDGSEVVISVRDTGKGIPPEKLPKVFDMFLQVDPTFSHGQGGLGIGLTLVKRLTEMHGGRVEAKSHGAGHGSEFLIRLPLAASPMPTPNPLPAAAGNAEPLEQRRILVVDDNRDVADSLAMLLRCLGAEVTIAYSGKEAIESVPAFSPHVVLLDLGMPDVDGYDVARQIRQTIKNRNLRLIALTGWGQEADRRRTAEAGFDHHLVKPVDPEALEALLSDNAEPGQAEFGLTP
jgi:CheY-like chemotaxis protein